MQTSNSRRADLVLRNGKIVTMAANGAVVDAVAVAGDRILATGTRSEIESLIGEETELIDLGGRVALPGFIDTHVHIDCTATHTKLATSCHIPPVDYVAVSGVADSRDAILESIKAQAEQTPVGQWIIGQGRFILETDGNSPTRRQLDEVAPDHPVMLRYSAHAQLLNSRALEAVGISRDAPSQDALDAVAPAARIRRDPTSGEPTGVVNECVDWVLGARNPWPDEALQGAIEATCREAVGFGVTGIHEFVSWSASARIYQELHRSGELPLRVQLCPCIWGLYQTADIDVLVKLGIQTGFGNDWLKFGSVKIFVDGEGRDEQGVAREWPRISQERLNALVLTAHRGGIRVMMHATSREGQEMAIAAVETALNAHPRSDHRHRIEHFAGDYWPEGLARLKRAGIIPVPTPYSSLGWYGDPWLDASQPGDKVVPYRSLVAGGFMPPGNSDCMGTEPEALNPWWSIWCVVARKTRSGRAICPEEGLGVMDAIRLYTTHSAYAGFEEAHKGSIEPGKLADLIVLSEDPFAIPPDGLREVRVVTTLIGGEVVHATEPN
ncbi:MAG: amidohydrolase [Deltaproteobacteria bacterium]|jgi:predicted amidohydrolase YtcJ|nr:amidohydrolase [Deltaproteobacteria bacterium]